MTARITASEVIAFSGVDAQQTVVQSLIDFVDQADPCLDGQQVPDASAKLLKIYGVCHMLQMQSGGAVTSERSMTGDAVSYAAPAAGTNWLAMMRGMAGADCVEALVNRSSVQVFSVGRKS